MEVLISAALCFLCPVSRWSDTKHMHRVMVLDLKCLAMFIIADLASLYMPISAYES